MIKKVLIVLMILCINLEATMKLISPAFSDNEAIPVQYTCDGVNISPALAWSDAPEHTNSFALIVDDPDAVSAVASAKEEPKKVWVHWIVFNIPSSIDGLLENTASTRQSVPFMQGATDFNGAQKWGGPCPPNGTHRYRFTLYALDILLDLQPGATKEQLLSAMHGHILEQARLIGTYQRKKG